MEDNRAEKTEMAAEDRTSETSVTEEKKRTESMKSHRERGEASRFRLTGSLVAKVAAFLLMLVSAAVCAVCVVGCYAIYEGEMYSSSYTTILKSGLNGEAHSIASRMYNFLNNEYGVSARLYLKDTNAEVAIMRFEISSPRTAASSFGRAMRNRRHRRKTAFIQTCTMTFLCRCRSMRSLCSKLLRNQVLRRRRIL